MAKCQSDRARESSRERGVTAGAMRSVAWGGRGGRRKKEKKRCFCAFLRFDDKHRFEHVATEPLRHDE